MNVLIIEDEWPVYEHLAATLRLVVPGVFIFPQITSVKQAVSFLQQPSETDLIFADIHLQDGNSLDIFNRHKVDVPVVFVTAYDQYLLASLKLNGIDYLLKPVSEEKLQAALQKYSSLQNFFAQHQPATPAIQSLQDYKQRVVVRKGMEYQLLPVAEIAYFVTEHKLVFAVDHSGKKYMCDEPNLAVLAGLLDPRFFFRANRQFIIHVKYLEKFHTDERSRVLVKMNKNGDDPILVSQENAQAFRKWAGQTG